MRLAATGWIALTLLSGCVRFGYEPSTDGRSHGADGGGDVPMDGSTRAPDSAVDSGRLLDSATDAAMSGGDAGELAGDGGDGATLAPPDAGPSPDAALDSGMDDAGAMDSGPADSGGPPVDAGSEYDDPRRTANCPPGITGALFCDSFEDPTFDIWGYRVEKNGYVEHSTAHAHSGSGSLRAFAPIVPNRQENFARLGVRAVDHMKSGELWARYYYYVPSEVVVSSEFSTVVLSEIEPPYYGFSLTITSTNPALASGGLRIRFNTPFPRDRWVCVELYALIADTGGTWTAVVDGVDAVSWGQNTLPAQGYTAFEVGLHYVPEGENPVEAFVDDVVVATSRPGC